MSHPLHTPLYDWHVAHHGRMVEFGGWMMPVQYQGIVAEHLAVRQSAGLFDISHMGRLRLRGPEAGHFLDRLLTCSVATLVDGQMRYGLVCRDDGGILDDVLVGRIAEDDFSLVVNAGNRPVVMDWIATLDPPGGCQVDDETAATLMIAVQGPQALPLVQSLCDAPLESLRYYRGRYANLDGVPAWISRTGYTGEDGVELVAPAAALRLWERLIGLGITPCGLGARDTLRLEAGMPLYGHELSVDIDPYTAGLTFAVKLDKPDFLGRSSLATLAQRTDLPRRIGLRLAGKRIAREGETVVCNGVAVGKVTSGTFSPTLQQSIAMAYVEAASADVGTEVQVEIRGKCETAQVCALPFYRRAQP
jgi:aminomethyltransferase